MNYRLLFIFLATLSTLVAFPEVTIDEFGLRFGLGKEKGENIVGVEAMGYLDSDCCGWNWSLIDTVEFAITPEASLGFINGHGKLAALVHLGLEGSLYRRLSLPAYIQCRH